MRILLAFAATLILIPDLRAQDVTISTPYEQPLTSKEAKLYYNGRAVGTGKEAFQIILDRVAKLPAGTSVVWGPNYDRCGGCADGGNQLKILYPDLWSRLEQHIEKQGLILSSAFMGERLRLAEEHPLNQLPMAIAPQQLPLNAKFAATLDWEIGPEVEGINGHDFRSFRFQAAGKEIHLRDLELWFGQHPEQSRVLIRLQFSKTLDLKEERNDLSSIARDIRGIWQHRRLHFARPMQLGKLQVTLVAPAELVGELNGWVRPLEISWSNFHGPMTPHGGVLYFANGKYLGHGNSGFEQVLAKIRQLPAESYMGMTQYRFGGRSIAETMSDETRAALNEKVRDLVPFSWRRKELEAIAKQRQLITGSSTELLSDPNPVTVIDWQSGDRYGAAFASFGRIVRHDDPRRKPAALLGWSRFEPGQPESTANYTLNHIETGIGDVGFEAALNQLARLPAGSLVQVRVCIRTKPPFICPLVYQDQRHFERTGYEPYVGMFPWLIDVAKKHRLQIEWLPDEGKSLQDCELNK